MQDTEAGRLKNKRQALIAKLKSKQIQSAGNREN